MASSPSFGRASFLSLLQVRLVPRFFFLKKKPSPQGAGREAPLPEGEEGIQHHPTEEREKAKKRGSEAAPPEKTPPNDPTDHPLGPKIKRKSKDRSLLNDATF